MTMWKAWKILQPLEHWPSLPTVYIGCMTGTSADGQADFTAAVFDQQGDVLGYYNQAIDLPQALQQQLVTVSQTPAETLTVIERSEAQAALSHFLSQAYMQIIRCAGLGDYARERIVLSPHGQTVHHHPLGAPPYTDVIVTGETVAYTTGYRVVTRHRQSVLPVSLAAPLAPVLLRKLFHSEDAHTVIVNGGGMANICVLPADPDQVLIAYDTGPANAPLDEWVQYALDHAPAMIPPALRAAIAKQRFDVGGSWAEQGCVDPALLARLLSHPYFELPAHKKSVDRASFGLHWIIGQKAEEPGAISPSAFPQTPEVWADYLATLAEVTVFSITQGVVASLSALAPTEKPCRLLVYGGIASNQHLVSQLIKRLCSHDNGMPHVVVHEDMLCLGYHPDFIESLLLAYLGCCADQRQPIDLNYCARPGVRGVAQAVPGVMAHP